MRFVESDGCCGLEQMWMLNDTPEETLAELCELWFADDEFNGTFLVFSDISPYTKGDDLMKYIRSHRLGSVKVTSPKENPNSDNMLKIYLWTVNIDALKALAKKKNWRLEYCDCDCPHCEFK